VNLKQIKVLRVTWVDVHQEHGWVDNWRDGEAEAVTVGLLVADTPEKLVLTESIVGMRLGKAREYSSRREDWQLGCTTQIPKAYIRSIEEVASYRRYRGQQKARGSKAKRSRSGR
jgi:hypothetical protein